MSYGEHKISNDKLDEYWTWSSIQIDTDSNESEMDYYFKTHIISVSEATHIWRWREQYEWCIYNTPSEQEIKYYYKYYKQGNVKNPVITLINNIINKRLTA